MTARIWQAMLENKHMASLFLFVLLNGLAAIATLFLPFYALRHLTWPAGVIFFSSLILLPLTLFRPDKLINLNIAAFFYGVLWAAYFLIKNNILEEQQHYLLIITLSAVLLIAILSFVNSISAFLLNSLPLCGTLFLYDHHAYKFWIGFVFFLSLSGVALRHYIEKYHDEFIRRMMRQLKEERAILSDLSMLDPLTRLYNRRGFQHQFDTATLKQGQHFIMLLDIDHFKSYNDRYGHTMGDQTLMQVSAAIRNAVRARDIVARYGGEEFLVMLTDTQSAQALQTAERIRQCVYNLNINHQSENKDTDNITISIGITPLSGNNIEQALTAADKALYRAKDLGRNKILLSDLFEMS